MYLSIYDLSGIQNFIFATNKLREIVGASLIVRNALSKNIRELSHDYPDAKPVYIGGGNALVQFDDVKDMQEFTLALKKKTFLQSGGMLRLTSASIEADERKSLAYNQKILMSKLEQNKRITPNIGTANGFSINAHENTTFEPVLLFGNVVNTKSKHLKLGAYLQQKNENIEKRFTDNFDDYRIEEEGFKNYLAVIHIDGNTMGMLIREFIENLADKKSFEEQLKCLAKLSQEINEVFNNVLDSAIDKVYNDKKEIPFRKIICDGDDISVICLAKDAFRFISTFMELLATMHLPSLGKENKITAGAGIAIVKFRFPFYTAYEIAEQLCRSAKKKALECGYSGKNSRSSVDYHVSYGGLTTDVNSFRKQNYKSKYEFSNRPYIFNSDEEIYDYVKSFENSIEEIRTVARNKLKDRNNEYSVKYFDIIDVLDFIMPSGEEEGYNEND